MCKKKINFINKYNLLFRKKINNNVCNKTSIENEVTVSVLFCLNILIICHSESVRVGSDFQKNCWAEIVCFFTQLLCLES